MHGNRAVLFQEQDGKTCKRFGTDATHVSAADMVQPV